MESKAEVYKRIIGNVAYSLSGSGHNSQVEQAMEEYNKLRFEEAIKEIEKIYNKEVKEDVKWADGLKYSIQILKSKL